MFWSSYCATFYRPCLNLACRHEAGGNHFFQKSHDMFPVYWQCQTKWPTGIQSTKYMQLVLFQNILGMDPPMCVSVCVVCLCVTVCVWCSLCKDMFVLVIMSMYVTCQLPLPTSTYPASCSYSTHVPSEPSQIAAYPPFSQTLSRTSRQQTGTLHLLEKTEVKYHSTPCSQCNSLSQSTAVCWMPHWTALAIWWKVLLQEETEVQFFLLCFFFQHVQSK